MLYKNHGWKKTAYCLAFQSETFFYLFQQFSCLEEYEVNKSSKSKQEHLGRLMLYKVYTRQHKFPFSSVLQTRASLMP